MKVILTCRLTCKNRTSYNTVYIFPKKNNQPDWSLKILSLISTASTDTSGFCLQHFFFMKFSGVFFPLCMLGCAYSNVVSCFDLISSFSSLQLVLLNRTLAERGLATWVDSYWSLPPSCSSLTLHPLLHFLDPAYLKCTSLASRKLLLHLFFVFFKVLLSTSFHNELMYCTERGGGGK